jgi:hypothetical protein
MHLQVLTTLVSTGSQRGKVSDDQAAFLVSTWIFPIQSVSEREGDGEEKPEEIVRAALKKIQRVDKKSLMCDEFIELCDYLSPS